MKEIESIKQILDIYLQKDLIDRKISYIIEEKKKITPENIQWEICKNTKGETIVEVNFTYWGEFTERWCHTSIQFPIELLLVPEEEYRLRREKYLQEEKLRKEAEKKEKERIQKEQEEIKERAEYERLNMETCKCKTCENNIEFRRSMFICKYWRKMKDKSIQDCKLYKSNEEKTKNGKPR